MHEASNDSFTQLKEVIHTHKRPEQQEPSKLLVHKKKHHMQIVLFYQHPIYATKVSDSDAGCPPERGLTHDVHLKSDTFKTQP